jgi:hypothetical protein
MEWWYYALFAIVLIGCAFAVRTRRSKNSNDDRELNRRIDERVDRLDLTRLNRDRDS